MADVFTKAKRSEVMSRIRGKGSKDTEVALAKWLTAFNGKQLMLPKGFEPDAQLLSIHRNAAERK